MTDEDQKENLELNDTGSGSTNLDDSVFKQPNISMLSGSNTSVKGKRKPHGPKRKQVVVSKPRVSPRQSPHLPHKLRSQSGLMEDVLAQDFSQLSVNMAEARSSQTGLSFDVQMTEHHCLWDQNYPECPERFSKSLQRCRDYGLVERCKFVPCRPATDEELLLQHSREVMELVRKSKDVSDPEQLERLSSRFDAVYFHPSTYELARLAVGSTIDLVTGVVKGKLSNAMGLIRPPGHHAMREEPCGYCYFNNVAIAAKHAVDNLGVKRVLIVDWDVHHGQASQYMFYNDPRVLYFSIHRYEHGDFWPNLRESNFDFVGEGRGKGYNFNVPLNKIGMGNADYLAIFHQLLLPVAYEFSPELVLVSSGYDAALGCFEGCMEVTPACYAHLINHLKVLADGKICAILEGGYCLKSLSEGVALTLRALLGDPCPRIGAVQEPSQSVVDSILDVIFVQRQFWRCLQFQGVFSDQEDETPPDMKRRRHVPELKFLGSMDKPVDYPTRDCYPVQSTDEVLKYDQMLDALIAETSLGVPPKRTCLVYDERMLLHKNHVEQSHPERPDRLLHIFSLMEELNIVERCLVLKARSATEEELALVHAKSYVDAMKNTQSMKPRDLYRYQEKFQSIYFCQDSYQAALMSVGCLFQVVDEVLDGRCVNGVAIIRPPGHHAESDSPCGFCIFNNVALATKMALTKHALNRVLIVDWDVHHGNGIQHMFEDDPRVLYISLHRYDKGSFFPCSDDANYDKIGKGIGTGFNVNIPWNKGGMNDDDYISAFLNVILPMAYQFDPELVLVSAGFDAARGDPLGGCRLTPEVYGHMTHLLTSLANGKVVLALEGGYNLSAISQSMACCTRVLLGDPCPKLGVGLHPCSSAVTSILNVMRSLQKHWSCFKFQVDLPFSTTNIIDTTDSSTSSVLSALTSNSHTIIDSIVHGMEDLKVSNTEATSSRPSLGALLRSGSPRPQTVYAVTPLNWCPHLESVNPIPPEGLDIHKPCHGCKDVNENWICLTCYQVNCGRFINQDMLLHNHDTGHCVVLSFTDFSVWCYGCEAYLDNSILTPVLEMVHRQKFGEDLPVPKSTAATLEMEKL